MKDWSYLTKIIENKQIIVTKVKTEDNISIEGEFELPPLAKLSQDDQVFVAVFVKSHGSIKEMERHFGVSYPTIKSRLNQIGEKLDFVEIQETEINITSTDKNTLLEKLERGEISVDDALTIIEKGNTND